MEEADFHEAMAPSNQLFVVRSQTVALANSNTLTSIDYQRKLTCLWHIRGLEL